MWKEALASSSVRLQWDPDHAPSGAPLARRAIQLGLRGEYLARYAREWIMEIEDITPFAREQHAIVQAGEYGRLVTPREWVYPVQPATARKKEYDSFPRGSKLVFDSPTSLHTLAMRDGEILRVEVEIVQP